MAQATTPFTEGVEACGFIHLFCDGGTRLATCRASAAQTAHDVSGTWNASFVTAERTYPAGIEFKQDGQTLTGNLCRKPRIRSPVRPGHHDLTFTFQTPNPSGDGSMLSIGVKCTLDKDALSGEFTVNDGPGGTFSAAAGCGGARQDRRQRSAQIAAAKSI